MYERFTYERMMLIFLENPLLNHALKEMRQMSDGPGSASHSGDMNYSGSRRKKNRREYCLQRGVGFVELHPKHVPTGNHLFGQPQKVSDVDYVEWQS